MSKRQLIPDARIERSIVLIRGQKVILDADLADLYGVSTKILNQAVKRNLNRFPNDFMIRLSAAEAELLQPRTAAGSKSNPRMRSQIVTASKRNVRYLPYAFTEQGVAMLSSVLHSDQAIEVNIAIMRAFVRLREMIASHKDIGKESENRLRSELIFASGIAQRDHGDRN